MLEEHERSGVCVYERERKIVAKKGVNCRSSSWSDLYRHLFIRRI